VTCAFKRGLEMRAIIEDENAEDGVQLRSYCQNHSLNKKAGNVEDFDDEKGQKKNLTAEERSLARRQKILKIESEFYKHVDLNQASRKLGLEMEAVDLLFRFWILKRRSLANRPLFIPRADDPEATGVSTANTSASEDGNEREKLKRFVALRQDLEKVRNCCYMLSKREKLKKSMVKMREQILEKQLKLFTEEANVSQMSNMEMSAILEANHGPGVYDRLFAHSDAEVNTENDFEIILSRLSGEITESSATIRRDNPYRNKNKENQQSSSATEPQNKPAYKRIFSDSSEPSDDELLPVSLNHKGRQKDKSNLMTIAEIAAKNADKTRQKPVKGGRGN
jgi:hypothetical protein